jgi:chemotaxis signal transduction protein
MLNSPLPLQKLSSNNDRKDNIRAIVFSLSQQSQSDDDRLFALPVEAVTKIIPCPPLKTKIKQGIGAIELDSQMLTIVDLGHKFNPESSIESSEFLILFQIDNGELCGIPVPKSPMIIDIPLNIIHVLPLSFRQVNDLNFATHMAIFPRQENAENCKIYLIGMTQILAEKSAV